MANENLFISVINTKAVFENTLLVHTVNEMLSERGYVFLRPRSSLLALPPINFTCTFGFTGICNMGFVSDEF